jgi:hypothetical protein
MKLNGDYDGGSIMTYGEGESSMQKTHTDDFNEFDPVVEKDWRFKSPEEYLED